MNILVLQNKGLTNLNKNELYDEIRLTRTLSE